MKEIGNPNLTPTTITRGVPENKHDIAFFVLLGALIVTVVLALAVDYYKQ